MVPWGTQIMTGCQSGVTPLTIIHWARPISQLFTHHTMYLSICMLDILSRRILWVTISKASPGMISTLLGMNMHCHSHRAVWWKVTDSDERLMTEINMGRKRTMESHKKRKGFRGSMPRCEVCKWNCSCVVPWVSSSNINCHSCGVDRLSVWVFSTRRLFPVLLPPQHSLVCHKAEAKGAVVSTNTQTILLGRHSSELCVSQCENC